MPETPDSKSEEIAPPPGLEGAPYAAEWAETAPMKSQAETLDATIRVAAPVPRGSASSRPRGWQPPSVEQLQQMLPQYDVTSFIACGGMGAVYKGSQKALKRPVAIKVLPPEIEDGDLQFSERFKHEAQAMARLTHPNIVAVFDAGETPDGLLYFVMEFVEGTDVAHLISSEGLLDSQRAIDITVAVCEALAFAHEEGIVHRDIKPSNIMIDKRGRVKVADFGLAKSLHVEATLLTGTNMTMGTPDFIAPEALIPGMKIDQRADLYAVGVMLYQMLTGKIPRGRFHLPSSVIPQIDPRFDLIVDKAMQTDREHRYSTAFEIKADVEKVRSGSVPQISAKEGVSPSPKSSTTPAPSRMDASAGKSRSRKITIFIGSGILMIAAGVLMAVMRPLPSGAPDRARGPKTPGTAAAKKSPPIWQKPPMPDAEFIARSQASMNAEGEIVTPRGLTLWQLNARNIAIRGELRRMAGSTEPLQVSLRHGGAAQPSNSQTDKASRSLVLYPTLSLLQLNLSKTGGTLKDAKYIPLTRVDHPSGLDAEKDWVTFEFAVVGDASMAKLAGIPLLPVGHAPEGLDSGSVQLQGGMFRHLEYIDLDSVSDAEALEILGVDEMGDELAEHIRTAPAAEPWLNVLRDPSQLQLSGEVERTVEGLRFNHAGAALVRRSSGSTRDGALRMRATFGGLPLQLFARHSRQKGAYQLSVKDTASKKISLTWYDGVALRGIELKSFPLSEPLQPGQEYELELRLVGETLTASFNGSLLGTVHDTALSEGDFGVSVTDKTGASATLQSLEFLDLDPPKPTSMR